MDFNGKYHNVLSAVISSNDLDTFNELSFCVIRNNSVHGAIKLCHCQLLTMQLIMKIIYVLKQIRVEYPKFGHPIQSSDIYLSN